MNKTLKVMTSAALLAGVVAPVAVTTVDAASASITALSVPTVDDADAQALGAVKIVVPAGALKDNDTAIVKLPYDVATSFVANAYNDAALTTAKNNLTTAQTNLAADPTNAGLQAAVDTAKAALNNYVFVPAQVGSDDNGVLAAGVTLSASDDELQITVNSVNSITDDAVFFIYLNSVDIDEGDEGAIDATIDAPANSGFPTGKVTVGTIAGSGSVSLEALNTKTDSETFIFDLRIKEAIAKSLKAEDETIKLKLPKGFKWTQVSNYKGVATDDTASEENNKTTNGTDDDGRAVYGSNINYDLNFDDETLTIDLKAQTSLASLIEIPLGFEVDDETKIESGDINVTVLGESNITQDTLKVGTYGSYETNVSLDGDVPSILSGKIDQEIGKIKISESIAGSIVDGRTVQLTLPTGAKWLKADSDTDGSVTLDNAKVINNGKTLKFTADVNGSTRAKKLILEKMEVAVEPTFTGDLTVSVDGSAGVKGDVVVAKVQKPVEVTAVTVPEVIAGLSDQTGAEITIKEAVKGALKEADSDIQGTVDRSGLVQIELPGDVDFVGTPKVEVTEGDIEVKGVKVVNDDTLQFEIDNESDVASTIKISGVSIKTYRSVPEGSINASVKGDAVVETSLDGLTSLDASEKLWETADSLGKVTIAKVTTPAEGKATVDEVTFKIGATTYTVAGAEKTMDVAPFVEAGRTYMPIRYVAEAVGVNSDSIFWDQATQTATLIKGDRVVQLTAGSKSLKVNGASITMDAAAKVKDGRTVLPVRFVGQAMGATVDYDATAQTVTVK